jgi:hypothetical protein
MYLDVVIPTLNRKQKLIDCLESIIIARRSEPVTVYVYFSKKEELDYFKDKYKTYDWIKHKMTDYKKCSSFWNSHLNRMKADAMCYLNDDVMLYPDTIERIKTTYLEQFSDFDGVLGICQANIPIEKCVKSAFGVIGKKYAERFPNKGVFCPDYARFYGDAELQMFAESINKFYFTEDVKLIHRHPEFSKGKDDTHRKVREFKEIDTVNFNKRRRKNYLWGRDFNLIGE